jgi:hypothetical protein
MERRHTSRRCPGHDEPISRLRLRTGREMTVVDVASGGVLVEGHARLLPGTHVDVHIITRGGRLLVRSRVTRCYVSALESASVCYRGALAFERTVDTAEPAGAGYFVPADARHATRIEGPLYPSGTEGDAASIEEHLFT